MSVVITNGPSNPVPVAGTISLGSSVAVNNFPTSQAVTGSVAVSNFPATQTISGTVTAIPSGTIPVSITGASGVTVLNTALNSRDESSIVSAGKYLIAGAVGPVNQTCAGGWVFNQYAVGTSTSPYTPSGSVRVFYTLILTAPSSVGYATALARPYVEGAPTTGSVSGYAVSVASGGVTAQNGQMAVAFADNNATTGTVAVTTTHCETDLVFTGQRLFFEIGLACSTASGSVKLQVIFTAIQLA